LSPRPRAAIIGGVNHPRTQKLAGLLLLLIAALAVYYPALERSFVYDEILVIRDSAFIGDPGNLLRLGGEEYRDFSGEQTYRPLVTASYILDALVWPKDRPGAPFGFGLTNLLIHVLAAWLLWLVVWRLAGLPRAGAAAALLFLVHPALVETVISPGNREQILSVLLMAATTLCWRAGRDGSSAGRFASPLLLLAALLTLEWSIFLPAALAAWVWFETDDAAEGLRATSRLWAMVAVYLALRSTVFPTWDIETPWLGGGPLGGLWAFGALFPRYLEAALVPLRLRPSYTYGDPAAWQNALGLLLAAAAAGAVLVGLAKKKRWAIGPALAGLALAPLSHIAMPFWIVMADRYLTLPLAAALPVLTAWLLRRPRAGLALVALLAVFWGSIAHDYALDWRRNRSLWQRAVELEPQDSVGWTNLGAASLQVGRPAEAVTAHRRALAITRAQGRDDVGSRLTLADTLAIAGQGGEACTLLLENAATDRTMRLAIGRHCRGQDDEAAKQALLPLVSRRPNDGSAWAGLCALRGVDTENCLREALIHCPDAGQLWLHVAAVHAARGDGAKTAQAAAMALRAPDGARLRPAALAYLEQVAAKKRKKSVSGP
jgi:protein O-mannosyl-transferase